MRAGAGKDPSGIYEEPELSLEAVTSSPSVLIVSLGGSGTYDSNSSVSFASFKDGGFR